MSDCYAATAKLQLERAFAAMVHVSLPYCVAPGLAIVIDQNLQVEPHVRRAVTSQA